MASGAVFSMWKSRGWVRVGDSLILRLDVKGESPDPIYGKRASNHHNSDMEDPEDVANLCDAKSANPILQAQQKTLQEVLVKGFSRSERLIGSVKKSA